MSISSSRRDLTDTPITEAQAQKAFEQAHRKIGVKPADVRVSYDPYGVPAHWLR